VRLRRRIPAQGLCALEVTDLTEVPDGCVRGSAGARPIRKGRDKRSSLPRGYRLRSAAASGQSPGSSLTACIETNLVLMNAKFYFSCKLIMVLTG
jgi:hypothetical protein